MKVFGHERACCQAYEEPRRLDGRDARDQGSGQLEVVIVHDQIVFSAPKRTGGVDEAGLVLANRVVHCQRLIRSQL